MPDDERDFLHALFAEHLFKEDEQTEVQSPDDEIPVCAVPETCAEPDEEQSAVLAAFAEDINIEQIIAEEGAEGDMPSLPEFRDILAEERMLEVLVEVEAEHSAHADCHIRIAGEIEVNLHCVNNDGIPCAGNRNLPAAVLEELVNDGGEVVCENDLFRKTDNQACESPLQRCCIGQSDRR